MPQLPIHRSSQLTEIGVYLKTIISQTSTSSDRYAFSHTDDYYFFGFIEDGQCRLNIDFEEYVFGKGSLAIIRPGQVHRIIDASNLSAKFLVVDSVLVDKEEKRIVQRLTTVIVGLVVENVANAIKVQSELQGTVGRHKEIVWEFRDLLENNIRINRSPSFYAGRLNITVAYLNEAVNAVLRTSVGRHIQDEIILQAKRKLVYTTASVKEIAHSLGFDDYSYFTRLFTKVVGISPTLFRRTYHE